MSIHLEDLRRPTPGRRGSIRPCVGRMRQRAPAVRRAEAVAFARGPGRAGRSGPLCAQCPLPSPSTSPLCRAERERKRERGREGERERERERGREGGGGGERERKGGREREREERARLASQVLGTVAFQQQMLVSELILCRLLVSGLSQDAAAAGPGGGWAGPPTGGGGGVMPPPPPPHMLLHLRHRSPKGPPGTYSYLQYHHPVCCHRAVGIHERAPRGTPGARTARIPDVVGLESNIRKAALQVPYTGMCKLHTAREAWCVCGAGGSGDSGRGGVGGVGPGGGGEGASL